MDSAVQLSKTLVRGDLDQISKWTYEGTAWCYMNSVMSGKCGDVFDPAGIATRTELAAVLTQYLQLKDKEA